MMQETKGIDSIEAALNSLLRFILDGEPVLNERAPGARPSGKPFTTFMIYWLEGNAHVYKDSEATDIGMQQTVADDAYVTARVVCYGKSAMKRCSMIRMALNSDVAQIQASKESIGICDIDDVQAIPEPGVDGAVRERAYFNFKFYAEVSAAFTIDSMENTSLALSVVGFNG